MNVLGWLFRKSRKKTYCAAFCPGCDTNLVEAGTLVSDDDCGVSYECSCCGQSSLWDFDAPAPLLLSRTTPR